MATIKCIGCPKLLREVLDLKSGKLLVYRCPLFPYVCALSGLLRPTKAVLKAVNDCPEDPRSHCVLCLKPAEIHYGQDIVSICTVHDKAWGGWLGEQPERRAYLAPRGRAVKANWIELFREFIEDMRKEGGGQS